MTSHAKLYRIAIRLALCLAALGGFQVASATYANLTPPPGWVQGGGALATYQAPAAAAWTGSKAMADAAIASASATSKIRVALPLAQPAAGRIAAAVLFANPALRTAVGVASWLGVGKLVWDAADSAWKHIQPPGGDDPYAGYQFRYSDPWGFDSGWQSDPESVCNSFVAYRNGAQPHNHLNFLRFQLPSACIVKEDPRSWNSYPQETELLVQRRQSEGPPSIKCPAGWTYTPAGCLSPAVAQPQFQDALSPGIGPATMPDTVPNELPRTIPWPVKDPVINPGTDGKPAPIFMPTGNPVKNPQYNPNSPATGDNQPYLQPGIRVVPTPTLENPWQVDIQPINRPVSSPDANPNPISDQPSGGDNDKPREDDRDLCQRNPDILACAKPELDIPDGDIPKTTKDVTYTPESLFGGGSCPANKVMNIGGRQVTVWNWADSCDYIRNGMRPVVLVLCAFAAFAIVAGGAKQ